MLVLFDTPAGHALFKVLKPAALEKPESLWDSFTSLEGTNKMCAAAARCRGHFHFHLRFQFTQLRAAAARPALDRAPTNPRLPAAAQREAQGLPQV